MTERLRRLAREHPDVFERVAEKMGGDVENRLRDILDDEVGESGGGREESDERSARHEWQLGDS